MDRKEFRCTGREAALAALARIDADPEAWDQTRWRCGTGGCFAHHVVVAAGGGWLHPDKESETVILPGIEGVLHVSEACDLVLFGEADTAALIDIPADLQDPGESDRVWRDELTEGYNTRGRLEWLIDILLPEGT